MSDISNKAIMIAVSLLVTIAITSSIITVIGYFRDIYAQVENTDISLRKKFTEYDMYDNTVMTGLDMENAYNKYKDDPTVIILDKNKNEIKIEYKTNSKGVKEYYLNNVKMTEKQKQNFYATKYEVTCDRTDIGATIIFAEMKK